MPQGQTVCDPRIGSALRQLRISRLLLASQAARDLGWSESKISRIEKARSPVRITDIERLLDLYAAGDANRAQLLDMARTAGQTRSHDPVLRASIIREWSPLVVPEFLRSPAYARAVLESVQPISQTPPSELTAAVENIAAMQTRLTTGTPVLQLHAVVGEAVLGNGFGTRETMRAQIELLIQLAGLPNVDLAIARTGLRDGPRGLSPFQVLSFEPLLGFSTPDKAILPGVRPAQLDDEQDTWPFRVAFDLLQQAADPEAVDVLKKHYTRWGS